MSKDIKALLAQKLAENSAKHLNANQSAHLELGNELKKLPLNKVRPNRFQPRTVFDEKEIASLAESINADLKRMSYWAKLISMQL